MDSQAPVGDISSTITDTWVEKAQKKRGCERVLKYTGAK